MLQEKYNNSSYWIDIHKNYSGTLRAVGWTSLSEEFNKLKYYSESDSFLTILNRTLKDTKTCSILEVGVGIGYWTELQNKYYQKIGVDTHVTALDMSPAALTLVKDKFPEINTIEADLKTVDINLLNNQYDLVTALMVLLHLTDIHDYIHALTFCAHSVRTEGYLILYEPILNKNFSPFNSIEYDTFTGNSIPRAANVIDNILKNNGLSKICVLPGASWLLNSPIQANSRLAFKLKRKIWGGLTHFIFGNDRLTSYVSKLLLMLDKVFKNGNADSATFVLYKKTSEAVALAKEI